MAGLPVWSRHEVRTDAVVGPALVVTAETGIAVREAGGRNCSGLYGGAFSSTWQRAMTQALKDKVAPRRFTFHDLRAYYTTQHTAQYGALPELHADTKTTAKVYDRSRVSVRRGLG